MTPQRPTWRLDDLVDYEFFLDADGEPTLERQARDRRLFLEQIAPALSFVPSGAALTTPQRRELLRRWLSGRRQLERVSAPQAADAILLPGEAFAQVKTGVAFTLAILGVILGWTLASAALLYSAGSEPINAFVFFVEFALIQVAVLLGAFVALAAHWWFPEVSFPSLIRWCMRGAADLAASLWQRHRVRIAGTHRTNAEALFGVLRSRHALYRGVVLWSLVQLTQLFVVSFNGGVLGAMTARHLFHDLDFGWESTWLDANEVAAGVKLIATPWAWLLHPGYPDPAQVAGSQNRKRGSARLDPASLKSWSQFLFGVVIVYGLLPRLLLLCFAIRAQRRILAGLRFHDARSELTLERMLTPTIVSLGASAPPAAPIEPLQDSIPTSPTAKSPHAPVPPPARSTTAPASAPASSGSDSPLTLDLTGYALTSAAAAAVLGAAIEISRLFAAGTEDLAADQRAFESLARAAAAAPGARVVGLLAAATPPMIASRLLLDQLRAALGPERLIRLVLVGRPTADGAFRPVQPGHREQWQKAVQARADAFLALA